MALRKPAEIDAPRTTVGTVPGTVPGVICTETLAGVSGGVFPAILRPVCTVIAGPFWKVTCGQVLAAVGNPTLRPNHIAIRRPTLGATCIGTSGRISTATSTVLCGSR
jgi:hypothetical protein